MPDVNDDHDDSGRNDNLVDQRTVNEFGHDFYYVNDSDRQLLELIDRAVDQYNNDTTRGAQYEG